MSTQSHCHSSCVRRRPLLTALAAAGISLAPFGPFARLTRTAGASPSTAPSADPASVLAAESVFFEPTGHTISGTFWQFWQRYGLDAFGFPISEPFEDGSVLNQYFQRARFELSPDGAVRLGLLGVEAGGAEHPPASIAGVDPETLPPGSRLIPESGHTVSGAFLPVYERWQPILGLPIAPERPTGNGYVQYFANARLEWTQENGSQLGLLGTELAFQRGVDTEPAPPPDGVALWSDVVQALVAEEAERRARGSAASGGRGFVPAPGEKWIAVSVARQRITAYEGTKPVLTDLVSTGVAFKGLTSTGIFAINRRVTNEIMDSTTIGYPRGHPKYYRLENVLYTQYYNGGEAIHYAWWHNNFGTPMSFGCVNLRFATARWFWDWATFGTRIVIA
ncbi:MAG: L,D-transpeptidase [Chloroflexi bacterium]|nr:L,D-transpeptidase [Chloroflexota bacterium]